MTILTPSNLTNIDPEYDIFDLDRLGYYITTNNQKFRGKLECMLYCASHGVDFKWVFNDVYYDCLDWSIEPVESLPLLYAQRAQQIRDKYDYLILHLSGGNDSGAILETFLLNDIKLDEVVMYTNKVNSNPDPNDRTAKNYFGELALCAMPNAKIVKEKFTDLKITVCEFSEISIATLSKSNWFESAYSDLEPAGLYRSNWNQLDPRYQRLTDQGKTVAHIDGLEKPRFVFRDQNLHVIFSDEELVRRNPDLSNQNRLSLIEHFFWGPSTARIVCKQAHMILRHINSLPNSEGMARWLMSARGRRWEDWIAAIIYPGRLLPKWDTEKGTHTFVREWASWFHRDHNTDFYINWKKGLDYLDQILPKKYVRDNSLWNGYRSCFTKPRKIGRVINTDNSVSQQ